MSKLEVAANEAVFIHQYDSQTAVKFIQRNVGSVSEQDARAAVKKAATFYKSVK